MQEYKKGQTMFDFVDFNLLGRRGVYFCASCLKRMPKHHYSGHCASCRRKGLD